MKETNINKKKELKKIIKKTNSNKKKKEPWRIIIGIIAIGYIIFMWIKKDILSIYATIPQEEAIPIIITTIIVSLIKVFLLTIGILFIKWIFNKINKK